MPREGETLNSAEWILSARGQKYSGRKMPWCLGDLAFRADSLGFKSSFFPLVALLPGWCQLFQFCKLNFCFCSCSKVFRCHASGFKLMSFWVGKTFSPLYCSAQLMRHAPGKGWFRLCQLDGRETRWTHIPGPWFSLTSYFWLKWYQREYTESEEFVKQMWRQWTSLL